MAEQKKEAREGVEDAVTVLDILQKLYGMKGTLLSPGDIEAFREKTRPVYAKWAKDIGVELVRSAETIAAKAK